MIKLNSSVMFHGRLISVSLCNEFHYIVPQEGKWIISEKVSLDWEPSFKTLEE